MTRTMALLIASSNLLLFLSGCAGTRVGYDKPGITQAERQQDMNECVHAAMGTSEGWRWPLFYLYQVDRDEYGRCLEARGYTTPAPGPRQRESVEAP